MQGRKWIGALLLAVLLLLTCGCGGGGSSPDGAQGRWVDVNSDTALDINGGEMTVTSGSRRETYGIKTVQEDGVTYLENRKGRDFGVMSRLAIRNGGFDAYDQVLDAEGHVYRFVREEDLEGYRQILDLSAAAPRSIASEEPERFSLTFYNSGGSYGLDAALPAGTYTWELERTESGYAMSLRVMGDSYVAFDWSGAVTAEYAAGLARLLEDAGAEALNGYYMRNDVAAHGWSLTADYVSGETLRLRAEGEAAAECPFDLPRILDYALEQAPGLRS